MNRVLFLAHHFPKPSETFVLRDLRWLWRNGFDFKVLTRRVGDVGLWERMGLPADLLAEAPPVRFSAAVLKAAGWRALPLAARHRRDVAAVLAAVEGSGAERVHSLFGGLPALLGAAATTKLGVPFSVSVHAADVYTVRKGYLRLLEKADFVVSCNEAAAEFLVREAGFEAGRVRVVRHVFELDGIEAEGPAAGGAVLALGRFVEKKGFGVLLEALPLAPGLRLVLGGDGPLAGKLKAKARSLGVEDRVAFPGWVEGGLPELLRRFGPAAMVAVPSVRTRRGDREGIPNVMLEAWALGLPVVATRSGSMEETARDGKNALLVPPGDAAALAGAMRRLLEDAPLSATLGRNGRRTVEVEFAPGKTVERLAGLLWD